MAASASTDSFRVSGMYSAAVVVATSNEYPAPGEVHLLKSRPDARRTATPNMRPQRNFDQLSQYIHIRQGWPSCLLQKRCEDVGDRVKCPSSSLGRARAALSPDDTAATKVIRRVIDLLDMGVTQIAEIRDGQVVVNEWLI